MLFCKMNYVYIKKLVAMKIEGVIMENRRHYFFSSLGIHAIKRKKIVYNLYIFQYSSLECFFFEIPMA